MHMQFIDICTNIAHTLLPQDCLLCGSFCGQQQLCEGCRRDLPAHDFPSCPVCAMPSPQSETCGACIRHPPRFDATVAAFAYAFPIDALLRTLKYHGRLAIAELAGKALAQRVGSPAGIDVLIPMPLHAKRLQERGFNQASEIARAVSQRTGIPLEMDIALRVLATDPQAGLPLAKRSKNIRGAFACTRDMSGKHVALLDDVMTSGASLNELADTLKAAGAARVECWVAARTLR
jgi:ComF family protein